MNLKTLNSPTVEARGNKIVHLMNRPYRQQSLLRFFNNNNNNNVQQHHSICNVCIRLFILKINQTSALLPGVKSNVDC